MYNPAYEPETDFTPTQAITADEARLKVKYYADKVKAVGFDINKPHDRYNWECLNYYNQIILKSKLKK